MEKAVVLLSAGLDSSVNLYRAQKDFLISVALTFDYGQRASTKEIEKSRQLCEGLGVEHRVIELSWLKGITQTSLVNRKALVPRAEEVSIDDRQRSYETASRVWVPNRNGVFLNIGAAFAESLGAKCVVVGFNKEEAATFPDNSKAYLVAAEKAFGFSTANGVKPLCYTADLNKSQIMVMAKDLGVDLSLLWPCYFAGESLCGECESCQRFERARKEVYANPVA